MKTKIINFESDIENVKKINEFIKYLKDNGNYFKDSYTNRDNELSSYHFRNSSLLIKDNILHFINTQFINELTIEYEYYNSITEYFRINKIKNIIG